MQKLRCFHPFVLSLALLLGAPAVFSAPASVIDAGFESGKAPDAVTEQLTITADTTRAHSGKTSLKMAAQKKGEWGNLAFKLDGKIDFTANHEISVWVYTEKNTRFSAYISADDGSGEPYTIAHAVGSVEPGKWCKLSGTIVADYWRKNDRDFKLIVRTRGTCWIDDLKLVGGLPETPGQVWPKLASVLHAAAGKRVTPLAPGGTLTLDARNAALAPDTGRVETTLPSAAGVNIPADGLLVFAIDAKDDLDLTGSLQIEPAANLQPGLRVAVLSDDTVVAAPGVRTAASWRATPGVGNRPGATPDIKGVRPASATVPLNGFRMTKGRHYITVAGPHMRDGGAFAKLELRAREKPAEKPLYTFAFFSDTHLGFGRITKAHSKINSSTGEQLEASLRQLKAEGAAFAILGGDMTDNGRRSMFEELARVVKNAGLPVYGCIGNHDTFRDSRKDIAETLAPFFPEGADKTDYAFSRPPLRFVVLDGSYWRNKDTPIQPYRIAGRAEQNTYREDMLDWLRTTLAKDTATPTIVISHYHFYLRRGVSPVTGYNLGKSALNTSLMNVLDAAPNVVATLNGHHHSNSVSTWHGITSIQNPAFATWPNAYRVCRVYAGRIEWEVRQMPNRGLIRESANAEMKLLWPLSTYEDDIAGTISLAPRKPAAK